MTSPRGFEELMAGLDCSAQQENIIRAIYNHRDEADLTYTIIGGYCVPKLTESQVRNSLYDFRSHFEDEEKQVKLTRSVAAKLGKKGRRLTG
jgi:hypothetical protein